MTTPGDLQERFARAAGHVPVTPGDVEAVRARGRRRRRRRRIAGIGAAVAVAVLAGTAVPQLLTGTPPISVDPVEEVPTSPGAEEVADAVLAWDHSRYGPEGVTRYPRPDEPGTVLLDEGVERAIGTPDGEVVVQREAGAPIEVLTADGARRELLPAERAQRLLAVDGSTVFVTRRSDRDGNGEDEEQLVSVAIAGDDAITAHGVSAGVEGFTDALAFGPDGRVAWLSCHLQCGVLAGDLAGLVDDVVVEERMVSDPRWYGGLAYAPDGSALAVVEGPDPVIGGTSDLVLLDATDGRELVRVPLEVPLELHATAVSFTPDGRSVVVGDHLRAFLVTDVAGDAPRVEPLAGTGGATLHTADGGDEQPDGPVTDEARATVLAFAHEALGWSDAALEEIAQGASRPDDPTEQAAVGLRRGPDEPMALVHLEREGSADPWRVTGGGHHAEEPEDTDGWWNSVQARDGSIRLVGHAPAWGGDRMTAFVLDVEDRRLPGPVEIAPDGTFDAVLEVPEQRDRWVTLVLVTLDAGDEVTSFAILRIPPGEFTAG